MLLLVRKFSSFPEPSLWVLASHNSSKIEKCLLFVLRLLNICAVDKISCAGDSWGRTQELALLSSFLALTKARNNWKFVKKYQVKEQGQKTASSIRFTNFYAKFGIVRIFRKFFEIFFNLEISQFFEKFPSNLLPITSICIIRWLFNKDWEQFWRKSVVSKLFSIYNRTFEVFTIKWSIFYPTPLPFIKYVLKSCLHQTFESSFYSI